MKKAGRILSIITLCALMLLMTACGGQKFKHGTISGSSYTSDFLGVKVTFDSDWQLFTDSQTATFNKMSDMSEKSIKDQFDKLGTVNEMIAAKPDGSSINIVVQDTTKTGKLKEKDYFTTGLELVRVQLESTGAKVSLKDDYTNFLGKSTHCIRAAMTLDGVTVHMIQIPIFKGDYIVSITFGSVKESDLPAFMALFKAA